jgi:bacteriocin resistance YdeI/OmpD-like protein
MRDAAGADAVDTVTVEITRAGEEPEIRVPMDLRKALAAVPLAQAGWEDITPMARRDWIFSISPAKQPETRRRRIEKACDMVASGKRRLCCFPGIKWLMKKNAKSCEMWLRLPNSQNRFRRGRQVLINAVTGKVGTGTKMSGYPTQYKRAPLLE